jgi:hypothetical protein
MNSIEGAKLAVASERRKDILATVALVSTAVSHNHDLPLGARALSFISPGSLYLLGNLLGLFVGSAVTVAQSRESSTTALETFFAGNEAAVALTVASLIFFFSGASYHKAWASSGGARVKLVRLGDLLSGFGAILLGLSLGLVSLPVWGLASASLHAVGKLGSAILGPRTGGLGGLIYRGTRWTVFCSRGVGLIATFSTVAGDGRSSAEGGNLLVTGTLAVCYLIWASADFLLLSKRA